MKKLVFGVGVNDVGQNCKHEYIEGKRRRVWVCPVYVKWGDMLRRSYGKSYQNRQPTYMGTTVCDEWLIFSNFKRWVLDVQVEKDWERLQLDKDILIPNNKIYSPETCCFVPQSINLWFSCKRNGKHTGVDYDKRSGRFYAICKRPKMLGGSFKKFLGSFDTALEAHLAWKAKKHEYSQLLADKVTDLRVAEVLRKRFIITGDEYIDF
jgi:hypothetical protein